eukprot:3106110-Rhodomonas_salina.4
MSSPTDAKELGFWKLHETSCSPLLVTIDPHPHQAQQCSSIRHKRARRRRASRRDAPARRRCGPGRSREVGPRSCLRGWPPRPRCTSERRWTRSAAAQPCCCSTTARTWSAREPQLELQERGGQGKERRQGQHAPFCFVASQAEIRAALSAACGHGRVLGVVEHEHIRGRPLGCEDARVLWHVSRTIHFTFVVDFLHYFDLGLVVPVPAGLCRQHPGQTLVQQRTESKQDYRRFPRCTCGSPYLHRLLASLPAMIGDRVPKREHTGCVRWIQPRADLGDHQVVLLGLRCVGPKYHPMLGLTLTLLTGATKFHGQQ